MKNITKNLKLAVKKEATLLRKHVTEKEKARLDIDMLDGSSWAFCIYGQLTGDCFNDRATELLNLCATPFAAYLHYQDASPLTKKVVDNLKSFPRSATEVTFSAIEVYITFPKAENDKLIAYIKGESDQLLFGGK